MAEEGITWIELLRAESEGITFQIKETAFSEALW